MDPSPWRKEGGREEKVGRKHAKEERRKKGGDIRKEGRTMEEGIKDGKGD
jgi:hypothetical protein